MSRNSANRGLAFVALMTLALCACSVKAPEETTRIICGNVDRVQPVMLHLLDGEWPTTVISMDDGRPIKLFGTPGISIRKGGTYAFKVNAQPTARGEYVLRETLRDVPCDGIDRFDTTDTAIKDAK